MMRKPSSLVDWTGILLHIPVGFVAGIYVYSMIFGWMNVRIESPVPGLLFLAGSGLIGSGMAVRYGDRLWFGRGSRVIPLNETWPDLAKERLAWVIAGCGVMLAAIGAVALLIALPR